MTLTLIGDIHGKYKEYVSLLIKRENGIENSLQIGDFGYNYSILKYISYHHNKFFAGNHDNHDDLQNWPHWLGKYGSNKYQIGDIDFFYVGGAFSVDWQIRLRNETLGEWPKTWYENEELTMKELENAIEQYKTIKPKIVISHDCPHSLSNIFSKVCVSKWGYNPETFRTRTSMALQIMFESWQPEKWFFGHYHNSKTLKVDKTEFRCLDELEIVTI